jgi:hypothetical protein
MEQFEIGLLLKDVAETFRGYEAHHRNQADSILQTSVEANSEMSLKAIADRREKAERNERLAERCEHALRELGLRTDDPDATLRSIPDSLEALAARLRDAIAKRAPLFIGVDLASKPDMHVEAEHGR